MIIRRESSGGAMIKKRRADQPPESHLPLPPATFHILVALADGELHGYAIMKGVAARSEDTVRLGPGTLYGSLKRLLATGLVEESGERADPERGDRSEEHTSELQSPCNLVCRLLLEKKKTTHATFTSIRRGHSHQRRREHRPTPPVVLSLRLLPRRSDAAASPQP